MYGVCADKSGEFDFAKGLGLDDMVNFGYRDEEHAAQAADDVRWNTRAQFLNLGRGHQAVGMRYAQIADNILAPLMEQAGNMAAGGLYMLGYLYDRNMLGYASNFSQSTAPGLMMGGAENLMMPMSS
jgi:hypothetical protein